MDFHSNHSSINATMCGIQPREPTTVETAIKLTAYTIAFALAIIGNALVIHIVFRKTNLRTTTNCFIGNMAFSDIVLAVVCMPSSMYAVATRNRGQILLKGLVGILTCKLQPFLQGVFIAVSVLTVSVLAGDRFLAIVYPFEKIISKRRAKVILAVIYAIGVLFSAPLLYAMTYFEKNGQRYCLENWEPHLDNEKSSKSYTIVMFIFFYILPLATVVFFYGAVIRELWRGKVHHNNTVAFRENKSVLKMVVTVTIVFSICWLPLHAITFISYFTTDTFILTCGLDPAHIFIGWFMGHVNTAINPIIYFIFAEHFRKEGIKSMQSLGRVLLRRQSTVEERAEYISRRRLEESSRTSSVYYSIHRSGQNEQSTTQLCPV